MVGSTAGGFKFDRIYLFSNIDEAAAINQASQGVFASKIEKEVVEKEVELQMLVLGLVKLGL